MTGALKLGRTPGRFILAKYLLGNFVGPFLSSLLLFALALEIVELFMNIWTYLNFDVPWTTILFSTALYFPKCLSYALPVALLFGASFSLGTLYSQNELIVVFGSGRSLFEFVRPLAVLALVASVWSFTFDEFVVLPTYRQKKELTREMLHQGDSVQTGRTTVRAKGGNVVYHVERFDGETDTVFMVQVILRDSSDRIRERLDASSGRWEDDHWVFMQVRRFRWLEDGSSMTEESLPEYGSPDYDEPPASFGSTSLDASELSMSQLSYETAKRRKAGQPYADLQTEYYGRWFFGLTPFIVVLLSASVGGRFKKNTLLMCLLLSLVIATCFYVVKLVTTVMASTGVIAPFVGAMIPVLIFILLAAILFLLART